MNIKLLLKLKEYILKFKEYKKSIFLFIIVFISGIITGISIISIILIQPNSSTSLGTTLASDDLVIINYASKPDETINTDYLNIGCINWSYYKSIIRFNLTEKPNNWSTCIIQIYFSKIIRTTLMPIYQYNLILDYNSWNENMSYTEFINTWGDWHHLVDFGGSFAKEFNPIKGFMKINITNYIENYDTISISLQTVYPGGFDYSSISYSEIKSKEAIVSNNLKPHLVWLRE
jgi:hypothetical protein